MDILAIDYGTEFSSRTISSGTGGGRRMSVRRTRSEPATLPLFPFEPERLVKMPVWTAEMDAERWDGMS